MSTMTLPDAPAPAPEPQFTTSGSVRFVAVHANLLPDEIIQTRRTRQVKRYVIIALGAVLALVVAVYGLSVWQTSRSKDDLHAAQEHALTLQHQQRQYQPLITAKAQTKAIQAALARLMAGDLQWKQLLQTLRSNASGQVQVTGVTGTVTVGAGATASSNGGLTVLNQSGKREVGLLSITGTAPDKNSIAAYVDALSKVDGLAAPFPASISGTPGKLSFSVNVIITSDALGGRYATGQNATGGN